ncbi:radical SAM protein, partial [bacterium]|nr:radical SAM protein [bacterium]
MLLGDGEELVDRFVDACSEVRAASRAEQLRHLAQVPGVYVPSLYEVTYDGEAIAAIQPVDTEIPATVQKQTYRGNLLLASPVVTE